MKNNTIIENLYIKKTHIGNLKHRCVFLGFIQSQSADLHKYFIQSQSTELPIIIFSHSPELHNYFFQS